MNKFKEKVAKGFSDNANNYSSLANTQKIIAKDLLGFSKQYISQSNRILDIGCGTGTLGKLMPSFDIVQIDIAEGMCRQARGNGHKTILADMDEMPFEDNSFDVMISSMTLQWSFDMNKTMVELKRVLKPGGKLSFSLLLDSSFISMKRMAELDGVFNNYFRLNIFDKLCRKHGLNVLANKECTYIEDKCNVIEALRSIKNIGASVKKKKRKMSSSLSSIRRLSCPVELEYQVCFIVLECK